VTFDKPFVNVHILPMNRA